MSKILLGIIAAGLAVLIGAFVFAAFTLQVGWGCVYLRSTIYLRDQVTLRVRCLPTQRSRRRFLNAVPAFMPLRSMTKSI
jgi:hypothetical protein